MMTVRRPDDADVLIEYLLNRRTPFFEIEAQVLYALPPWVGMSETVRPNCMPGFGNRPDQIRCFLNLFTEHEKGRTRIELLERLQDGFGDAWRGSVIEREVGDPIAPVASPRGFR